MPDTRRGARSIIGWWILAAILGALVVGVGGQPADAHTPHDSIDDVVVSPTYADDGKVFVIAANRLMVSTDMPYRWQPLVRGLPRAPEDGKSLDRIAISPSDPDVMYVSSRVGSAFRSDDGGASWQPASGGLDGAQLSVIAVSPDDPDVVLAGGATNRLYRTTDGGRQWTLVAGFGRVPTITFASGSGRAFVGDNQGRVSVSDDDGVTWAVAATAPGTQITATAASDAAADATVFAGTSTGVLLRSVDAGDSFAEIGTGLPQEVVKSIALSADFEQDETLWTSMASKGVYRSTDGGETWTRTSKGLTTDIQASQVGVDLFRGLAIGTKANGDRVLYEASFDGLSRSVDDGDTWTGVETLADYIAGLGVSPDFANDETVAVAGYIKGAYISTDAGERWKVSDRGLEHVISAGNKFAPVKRLHNIVFSPEYADDDTIFSASWTAFLKSTNRGRTWTTHYVTPPSTEVVLRQFVITVSPDYPSDRTIFLGSRQGDIYRSQKAGVTKSWELIGNAGSRIRSLVVDPNYPQSPVLFAGTEQGVMRSDDGGATWTRTGPDGLAMLAISPAYETDGTLFAGTETGLFVTRDRAATWTELAAAPLSDSSLVEALAVSPDYENDETVLVSVNGQGLYRSTDGGTSFVEVGTDLTEGNQVIADFTNPSAAPIQFSPAFAQDSTVFAYSGPFVVRSTDAGDSWDVLPIPTAAAYLRGADPKLMQPAPGELHHGSSGSGTAAAESTKTPDDGRDRGTFIAIGVGGLILLGIVVGGGLLFVRGRRRRARARSTQ